MRHILFLTIGLFTTTACSRPNTSPELVIAHPDTLAALPLRLSVDSPIAGISIRLKPYSDHTLAVAEFLRGESDLLFTGTTLGAMQASKGVQLWRTLVWGTASIVLRPGLKPLSPRTFPELNQKRVALPFRTSPNDIQLRRLIIACKIKPSLEYLPHTQAVALLLAEKIDAAVLPEPLASKLIAEHQLVRLAELAELEEQAFPDEGPAPMVSLFVRSDLSSEKKQQLPVLEQRLHKAISLLQKDPEAIARTHAPGFKVSPEILREGLRFTRFALPEAAVARRSTIAFLKAAGITYSTESFFMP